MGEEARERIRAAGRRIAVLDDDPTGSQAVHGVSVVTELDPEAVGYALSEPGTTCFILTNTRSLPEDEAAALNARAARELAALDVPVEIVSRSDSTLRGHVLAEVRALGEFDGVLFAPAYFEAGRTTRDDVHLADGTPVGETEFARDATFGYESSNLRDFLRERGVTGTIHSIRPGDEIGEILDGVGNGEWVVVNGEDYDDFEAVVLALGELPEKRFAYRTGPSFVRALAGIEPKEPLTTREVFPDGRPGGHGLVVVGSHVGLTSRQVEVARERHGLAEVELQASRAGDEQHVAEVARQVQAALEDGDALLFTSRERVRGEDGLRIARTVSAALVEVVKRVRTVQPAWVVAKGGITSHDVAAHGLDIRRAEVLGQLGRGIVSVFRPLDAPDEVVGMPYVVFAGNVGDEGTLAHVIEVMRG